MRTNYWSCSKFADIIRGTKLPGAKTFSGWRVWKKTASAAHPFRYWLAEEFLDGLQRFVMWPADRFSDVRVYLLNRFVSKTTALTASPTSIKPGTWCEIGDRILPCLFDSLVEFVETDLANMPYVCGDGQMFKWTRTGIFQPKRSVEAGLAHLDWEIGLRYGLSDGMQPSDPLFGKETLQATAAKEIKALYTWYTQIYLNRKDAMVVSGWSAYCEEKRAIGGDILDDDVDDIFASRATEIIRRNHEIEDAYAKEDTEMLCRLVSIRESLWT